MVSWIASVVRVLVFMTIFKPIVGDTIFGRRNSVFKNDVLEINIAVGVSSSFTEDYHDTFQSDQDAPGSDETVGVVDEEETVVNQHSAPFTKKEDDSQQQQEDNILLVKQGLSQHRQEEERSNRLRRDVSREGTPSRPISTQVDLHDNHTNALISWAGQTPDVVALTKTSGSSVRSNLYISTNYGRNFTNVVKSNLSCLCIPGTNKTANIDNLYHASAVQKTRSAATSYIFTDTTNKLLVTTTDLRTFTTISVDFYPMKITFHPEREDVVVAYGGTSRYRGATNNLYISVDFGYSWTLARSNVQDFQWGWQADQVFILVPSYFGLLSLYDVKELIYDDGIQERNVISNVQGFELQGSFLFATKRKVIWSTSSSLNLMVAKNDTNFTQAEFPVISGYQNLEYYIVDADEDRVMMCVVHAQKSTHLYVSDTNGTRYTLSLPNIVYISPKSVGGTSLPGLRYYSEPFADIHKVQGLRGIYIASQFLANASADASLADVNQTTRITYDKGGEWTHITAPYRDRHGHHTHCYWYAGCTLHLLQDFLFGANYRAAPILSSANAVGLVIGAGITGSSLKQETNPSIYLSTDAGFTWREVARGNYTYNFGDHGNLIVLVPSRKLTNVLYYSYNEGANFTQYQFTTTQLKIYGLLTEPGSKTGNFSIWGSRDGAHSWVIVHLNLETIFGGRMCGADDYKPWSPGVNETGSDICLLGEQEVIERKDPIKFCFNGRDYDRSSVTKICKCVRADYECDYGYIRGNETDDIWNPQPSFHTSTDISCVRDQDVFNITSSKPDFCPYGSSYTVTRGYRRIPGDKCEGGVDHLYDPVHRECPRRNMTDFLIYSTGTNIYKYDLKTQHSEFLVSGSSASEIYSVEFDYNRDILYWADQDSDAIMFYNISAPYPVVQTLFSGNTGKVECISLDWESDNIYMVDSMTPKIEIFSTLTHWRRVIVTNSGSGINRTLENPRALEVFPAHGYMFWTDWSTTNPRVMRATMAGLNPTVIVSGKYNDNLHWPNGLAVDFDNELMYVADGYTHKILQCDLEGNSLTSLLSNQYEIKHPFALTMLADRLYWSDWTDNQIKSVYKADGAGFYTLNTAGSARVMSLKAMTWDKQYKSNSTGCGEQDTTNGGCSNLCVPHPHANFTVSTNRVCLCSEESKPHTAFNGSTETCHCHSSSQRYNMTSGYCETNGAGVNCTSSQFACSSRDSRCIPLSWKCDRESDCSDHSDETNCNSTLCASGEFLCKINQKCIANDWICDGDNDCGDSSDETNCPPKNCSSTEFKCTISGRCVPSWYRCDGEYDCGAGDTSDEDCHFNETTCAPSQFRCNSTRFDRTCIPQTWVCDGEQDCDFGSDEPSNCSDTTCPSWQFKCHNSGRCISNSWICDGDNDCGDYSDERSCSSSTTTTAGTTTPRSGCFCYNHGGCVTYAAVCDGFNDCADGHDEWGCDLSSTTSLPWHTTVCNGFSCFDGSCVSASKVCDGRNDCHPYHEDETNCHNCTGLDKVPCAANRQQCIHIYQLCDGHNDCIGGTDEQGCDSSTVSPTCTGQFQCVTSKVCIDSSRECDNHWDCSDGSDEAATHCDSNTTVSNLVLSYKNATSASFFWNSTARSGANTKYVLQYILVLDVRNPNASGTWKNGVNTTDTYGTVSGLQPYTNYMFAVRAVTTKGDRTVESAPSHVVRLSTDEAPPGQVGHIAMHVNDKALWDNQWILSWHYPLHPRGRITKYLYNITIGGRLYMSKEVEAVGTETVSEPVSLDDYHQSNDMLISVAAVNGAGVGDIAQVSHCLLLATPNVSCAAKTTHSVTLSVHITNETGAKYGGYSYGLLFTYQDVDKIPQTKRVSIDTKLDYTVQIPDLSSGKQYTISTALEMFLSWETSASYPLCISAVKDIQCTTQGAAVGAVQGLKIADNVTSSSIHLSWQPLAGVEQYEVVLSYERELLIEGKYALLVQSNSTQVTVSGLISCKDYYIAVRAHLPSLGPLSSFTTTTTLPDPKAGPRLVHAESVYSYIGLDALYPNLDSEGGDEVMTKITWQPACFLSHEGNVVYVREVNTDYIFDMAPLNVTNGSDYAVVPLQRGGHYEITIQNGFTDRRNSSIHSYWASPYTAPTFILFENGSDIQYAWTLESSSLGYYYAGSLYVNIQYSENGNDFYDLGISDISYDNASCNLVTINAGSNYTIQMRYARLYKTRYYYGNTSTQTLMATVSKVAPSTSPQTGENTSAMYAGIAISIVVALVLTVVLSIWCVRHRRLQRSFLDFTSSHYNTRTDNATFSNDEDSPMIQGFSDDEPLVIA